MVRKSLLCILMLAVMMLAGCAGNSEYYRSGEDGHMKLTDDMQWYKYDPDNLFGISATVYDDQSITYVFEKNKCLFDGNDVKNAFKDGTLYGCKCSGTSEYKPDAVIYETEDDNVKLTIFYSAEDMEKVDGFWFYFSEDEYIRCGYTKSTMYANHIVIKERTTEKYDEEEYTRVSGDEWRQSWNLEGSGKWNEVSKTYYYRDDMPLE